MLHKGQNILSKSKIYQKKCQRFLSNEKLEISLTKDSIWNKYKDGQTTCKNEYFQFNLKNATITHHDDAEKRRKNAWKK